jgi:transcriptional regulator with XRE-family HTH domain
MSRNVAHRTPGRQTDTRSYAEKVVDFRAAVSDYAARIRAARAYAGLKQDELAGRLGVDTQTIKRREAGAQDPKRGELLAIAAITGVPVSFMEHGFGEVEPSEILERLARIEAVLAGAEAIDLEPLRAYVRATINALDEAGAATEGSEPTAQQAPGPPRQARRRPRAR